MHDELKPRHELKYFINRGNAMALAKKLNAAMTRDPNGDEDNNYIVRSLYFDDVYNTFFYDKIDGDFERDKYRIRIYKHDPSIIYLERKRKMGNLIQKTSVRVVKRLAEQIIAGEPHGLETSDNALLNDMFVQMRLKLLRPVVLVDYVREAYCYPLENVRVTFDKSLRSGLYSRALFDPKIVTVSPFDEDLVILEVKFDRFLPVHVARLLENATSGMCAISKYVLCRRFEPM